MLLYRSGLCKNLINNLLQLFENLYLKKIDLFRYKEIMQIHHFDGVKTVSIYTKCYGK